MLGHKVFGAGLEQLACRAICQDVSAGLTATGATQSNAYLLTSAVNGFTTVASGTGAILYSGASGDSQTVFNGGVNHLKVYPPVGSRINGLPINQAILLAPNTGIELHCLSTTLWFGILSA